MSHEPSPNPELAGIDGVQTAAGRVRVSADRRSAMVRFVPDGAVGSSMRPRAVGRPAGVGTGGAGSAAGRSITGGSAGGGPDGGWARSPGGWSAAPGPGGASPAWPSLGGKSDGRSFSGGSAGPGAADGCPTGESEGSGAGAVSPVGASAGAALAGGSVDAGACGPSVSPLGGRAAGSAPVAPAEESVPSVAESAPMAELGTHARARATKPTTCTRRHEWSLRFRRAAAGLQHPRKDGPWVLRGS
jgi:hypothetical protein